MHFAVDPVGAKGNEVLVLGTLGLGNGTSVQISSCPTCKGKIKSPLCCGQDMSCAV